MDRKAMSKLHALMESDAVTRKRFLQLRNAVMPIKASQYDVSNLCNLSCVGCLYFDGDKAWQGNIERSYHAWLRLFLLEKERGVNYPHIGGAEPALNLNALRAASTAFDRGVIYSNGTKFIPTDIRFKIHISVWGDGESEQQLRGKKAFDQALSNYSGDPRAIFIVTLTKTSKTELGSIARKCFQHQVKLSFNHYSPPISKAEHHKDYLRTHQQIPTLSADSLALEPQDYIAIHNQIEQLSNDYPNTIIHSRDYGHWIANNEGIYQLDEQSNAINCASRLTQQMRHFAPNTQRINETKCCTPNIECRTCRLYAMAYASKIHRLQEHLDSMASFQSWLNIAEAWAALFVEIEHSKPRLSDRELADNSAMEVP